MEHVCRGSKTDKTSALGQEFGAWLGRGMEGGAATMLPGPRLFHVQVCLEQGAPGCRPGKNSTLTVPRGRPCSLNMSPPPFPPQLAGLSATG